MLKMSTIGQNARVQTLVEVVDSFVDRCLYVENCVAEITHDFPQAEIVLAGDLNLSKTMISLNERALLRLCISRPAAPTFLTASSSLTHSSMELYVSLSLIHI